jgi:hypothetical protein
LPCKGGNIGVGTFEIKRTHIKTIDDAKIGALLKESFGNAKDLGGGKWQAALGPLTVTAWRQSKNVLKFESNQPTQIDDATATEVVRARNKFLQAATGFNAKERVKRAKKAVTGSDD